MYTFLLKYLRPGAVKLLPLDPPAGPVVTISREYGCNGSMIAVKLTQAINERLGEKKWRVITNEVLQEAAHELEVDVDSISHVFGADAKSMIADLIASFAVKQYTSDRKIKATITKIVHSFADRGNCVIVGRAGCVIAQKAANSVHIRLIAPLKWRVGSIQVRMALPYHDAENLIKTIDKHRRKFRSFFSGKRPDSSLYDVVYNCSRLTEEEVVDGIMRILESKGVFKL